MRRKAVFGLLMVVITMSMCLSLFTISAQEQDDEDAYQIALERIQEPFSQHYQL